LCRHGPGGMDRARVALDGTVRRDGSELPDGLQSH
jgi:hypothetical protein